MRDMTCDDVRELAGAFVLGALEPAEEADVRAHLDTCADAHAEIEALGGVLPVLGESVPLVEPAVGLKARIMAAAAADLEARGAPTATPESAAVAATAASAAPTAFPSADERAARRRRTSTGSWILRIAAVIAIVALGGWNLLLRNQLDSAQSYEQSVAAVIDVASQPGSLTAILTADGGTGSGLAAVDSTGQVTLAMQDLAATSGSTVYEAWVIGGDGKPVPLGSFTVGGSGTASFTASGLPTAPGIVIALTLEPGPGATAPTLPIISKGVAG
jgi:anti-sigma-K factor RskA